MEQKQSTLNKISLLASIVAVLIASMAYSRAVNGVPVGRSSASTPLQVPSNQPTSIYSLLTRLIAVDLDIRAGRVTDSTINEVRDIRDAVNNMNLDTDFNSKFSELLTRLRDGSNDATSTIEDIISSLIKSNKR